MATTHPTASGLRETLDGYLRTLKLPTVSAQHEELARQAEKSGWTFGQFLHRLCEVEVVEREQRRVARFQKQSGLPLEKTMASLDMNRFPAAVRRVAATLCDGAFAGRAENVLAFGLPGRGKTHLLCAIAHELIRRGIAVLFIPTYRLVQLLLAAKRDLRLDKPQLLALGVYPFVVPCVPISGTPLEDHAPPTPDFMKGLLEPLGAMVSAAGLRSADIKAGCGKCGACSSLSVYES